MMSRESIKIIIKVLSLLYTFNNVTQMWKNVYSDIVTSKVYFFYIKIFQIYSDKIVSFQILPSRVCMNVNIDVNVQLRA